MNVPRTTLLTATILAVSIFTPSHLLAATESDSPASSVVASPAPAPTAKPAAQPPLTARWLDLNTLSYTLRYRHTLNWHDRPLFDFGQDRYVADGRIKLDAAGRYAIAFHGSTGRYFNWSYADLIGGQYKDNVVAARAYKTPAETAALKVAVALDPNGATYSAGIPSRGGYFSFRQFYASLTPIDQVTVEAGSLAIEHGQNSEITSFDDDGYITGERVRVHDPKHLYFDQVAATWAYLGSPLAPSIFDRGGDFTHSNYQQYLVEKKFGKHVKASTDFTATNGTYTLREAATLKLNHTVIDSARLELYQRPNTVSISGIPFAGGSGFAISADKQLLRRVNFGGGFASVDDRYSVYGGSIYLATVGFAWNGDSYETGKRVFTHANVDLGKGVSLFGYYTHTLVPLTIGHNQLGFNGGINFDVKAFANSTKRVF